MPPKDLDLSNKFRRFVRELVRSKQGQLVSLALLASVLALWASTAHMLSSRWQDVLLSVGTSLATAGVVAGMVQWLNMDEWRAEELAANLQAVLDKSLDDAGSRALGLERISFARKVHDNLEALVGEAGSIYLAFLYEPLWSAATELEQWLLEDERRCLCVFLPDIADNQLMSSLARRHGMEDGADFRGLVVNVRSSFERAFSKRPNQYRLYDVPAPGPSYSGYLFDPEHRMPSAPITSSRDAESRQRRHVIIRLYRQKMSEREKLLTMSGGDGDLWETVQTDFSRLVALAESGRSLPSEVRIYESLNAAFTEVLARIDRASAGEAKRLDVIGLTLFTAWESNLALWLNQPRASLKGWTITLSAAVRPPSGPANSSAARYEQAERNLRRIAARATSVACTDNQIRLRAFGYAYAPSIHGIRFGNGDILMSVLGAQGSDEEDWTGDFAYEYVSVTATDALSRMKREAFNSWLSRSHETEFVHSASGRSTAKGA